MAACELFLGRLDGAHDESALSDEERAKAERFRRPHEKNRYRSSRSFLRCLLGAKTNAAPHEVEIAVKCVSCGSDEHGKPYLPSFPDLSFNLSHSENRVAVVVAEGHQVGVDIEAVPDQVMPALWQMLASQRERTSVREIPDWDEQIALWVRKEALLKATGQGLAVDPRNVDVDAQGCYPSSGDLYGHVWVEDVQVGGDYRCSVAMVGSRPVISRLT